ncbi:unnamed protein product [Caretta caretta]
MNKSLYLGNYTINPEKKEKPDAEPSERDNAEAVSDEKANPHQIAEKGLDVWIAPPHPFGVFQNSPQPLNKMKKMDFLIRCLKDRLQTPPAGSPTGSANIY